MSRPLTASEAVAALRRGAEVEQRVSLRSGVVEYLTASGTTGRYTTGRYTVRYHRVRDEGTNTFRDISEFSPVDEDEHVGEGVTVAMFAEPGEAVVSAASYGGADDRWVNSGMAAAMYWAAKHRA